MFQLDPVVGHQFTVQVMGEEKEGAGARFTECSGLSVERTVVQYEEGGVNDHVHILPGRIKYTNIVLKHGVTLKSGWLWKWCQEGLYDGKVQLRNVSIVLFNSFHLPIRLWNVNGAYPVKWSGPDLNSANSQVMIETLELAHQGLTMEHLLSLV
jgi:phage tail-like protein